LNPIPKTFLLIWVRAYINVFVDVKTRIGFDPVCSVGDYRAFVRHNVGEHTKLDDWRILNSLYRRRPDSVPQAPNTSSAFNVHVRSVTIGAGAPIAVPAAGVTLVVGGNNAGKSTLLRQMHAYMTSWQSPVGSSPFVLTAMDVKPSGELEDVVRWLDANARLSEGSYIRNGASVHASMLPAIWRSGKDSGLLNDLGKVVTLQPNARTRFDMTVAAPRRADIGDSPAHPLHYFEDDLQLFAELDKYSQDIFGIGLTLDPLSGSLFLRFGKVNVAPPAVDQISPEYRAALTALTPLSQQGDGVGSTLGLLIPLVAGRNPIAFIDEPEAFLHPPQAFKVGQTIAAVAAKHGGQIFVATHDRNIVAGVLSQAKVETAVVRIERAGDNSVAHVVEPERLRQVWSSASLRHSNILDGLFHRAVVIAENERDCMFYAAALEGLPSLPGGVLSGDVLFVSSHGKGGVEELAGILTAAHVPVVVAPDLDALSDKAALKKMVIATGGVWTSDIDRDFDLATAEFRNARRPMINSQVKALIDGVLDKEPGAVYSTATRQLVTSALSVDSPWKQVKRYGMAAFGADRQSADRLVGRLDAQGIVTVRVGELEGFAPALGVSKGKAWLPAALAEGAHLGENAGAFVILICRAILDAEKRNAQAA
jgi:predicted ATPase